MLKKVLLSLIVTSAFHTALPSDQEQPKSLIRSTGNFLQGCVLDLKRLPATMLADVIASGIAEQYLPKHALVKHSARIPLAACIKLMITALYHKTQGNQMPQVPALDSIPSWLAKKLLIEFVQKKASTIIQAELAANNIVSREEDNGIAFLLQMSISPIIKNIIHAKTTKNIITSRKTKNVMLVLLAYDFYNFLAGVYKNSEHASLKEDMETGWENTYAAWLCTIIHKHTTDF